MKPVDFRVNEETCVKCGTCVKDCLERLIGMEPFPIIRPENRDRCIHCGHCQAICPTGSITLDGHVSDSLEKAPKPFDETDIRNVITGRRSVREYHSDPVDAEKLERAVNLASHAPTSTNSRQVSYMIINGREQVEKLLQSTLELMLKYDVLPKFVQDTRSGWDRVFRNAPCVLIAHAPESILLSAADCATALATLELALPSFNLASCWAGIFTVVCGMELPAILSLPAGNKVYGALMIGRPKIAYKRVPFRTKPKIEWTRL